MTDTDLTHPTDPDAGSSRAPGDRMARTVAVCSVLVGDQPVRSQDPATVLVAPGSVVELLPPFAGG